MCIAVWAELATDGLNTYIPVQDNTVQVEQVTEFLSYDFCKQRVHIELILAVRVTSPTPVYLHCVHRRHITMSNGSDRFRKPIGLLGVLADELHLVERPEGEATTVILRLLNDKHITGLLPSTDGFGLDAYREEEKTPETEIPFTSVHFGPLPSQEAPYILGLSATIDSAAFHHLITEVNTHRRKYLYSIEGPDVVTGDIGPLDLIGLPDDLITSYERPYLQGIKSCRIPVSSYDIITCDSTSEVTDYVRLVTRLSWHEANRPFFCNGREYVVNAWHSDRMDFLILKSTILGR